MGRCYDVIFVGGGLANGLACLRLSHLRPRLKTLLLEREPRLGGDHTWSFHESDLEAEDLDWVRPLVSKEWLGYDVKFPRRERSLRSRYFSIRSTDFDEKMRAMLGDRVRLCTSAESLTEDAVSLSDGSTLSAPLIIDGTGWEKPREMLFAYQKFVGQTFRFPVPHGLTRPVIMDATCEQSDGYRFFYCLPWTDRELLVEDTHYSDGPDVALPVYRKAIADYCRSCGWHDGEMLSEEVGCLPIPLDGEWPPERVGPVRLGMRGGFFHATTGYSLPQAVEMASDLAAFPDLRTEPVRDEFAARSQRLWSEHAFFRLLNRMLFRAAAPDQRYRVLERFYGLPRGLIERFYRGKLRWHDFARILMGRPPVPIGKAMRCLLRPAVSA